MYIYYKLTINLYQTAPHRNTAMLENAQLSALLRSSFGLTVSLAISYFAMNWIRKSLDPSQKEKEKSKKKVLT